MKKTFQPIACHRSGEGLCSIRPRAMWPPRPKLKAKMIHSRAMVALRGGAMALLTRIGEFRQERASRSPLVCRAFLIWEGNCCLAATTLLGQGMEDQGVGPVNELGNQCFSLASGLPMFLVKSDWPRPVGKGDAM